MSRPPTERQVETWRLMVEYQAEHHGLPPSVRELQRLMDIRSPNTVLGTLIALVRRGLAVHYPRRGFVALPPSRPNVIIPKR